MLAPSLVELLTQHRQAAGARGYAGRGSFVFASNVGGPLSSRNVVNRGFQMAVREARLNPLDKPRLRFHDLRHCYASMMIAHGLSSTDVAAQLGHANSGITERIYIHQFNSTKTYQRLRSASEQAMTTNEGEESHTLRNDCETGVF